MAQQAGMGEAGMGSQVQTGDLHDELTRLIHLHDRFDQQKKLYLPMWQEIADRVLPDSSNILRVYAPGGKRTQQMFDATASLALVKYASAIESMLTPRDQKWHGLQSSDPELNEMPEVQEYYDAVVDRLFRVRYSRASNFAQQTNECYIGLGAYGNGALFTDDFLGVGIRYRSLHIAEIFYSENFAGLVDMVHRRYKMSVRQAVEAFQGNVPPSMKKMYDKGDFLTEYFFVHIVEPNKDYRRGGSGLAAMKYLSHYICWDMPWLCRTGKGYRTFPYSISRGTTVPGDVYARGIASVILPDIKQVNEMEKTLLRQAQLATDPPILMSEDGNLSGFNMQPGALVWGGLDSEGKEMAKPFKTDANFQVGKEAQEQKRKVINDAFLVNVWQILADLPEMTATQSLLREQEKGQLMAPITGRQQSEFLPSIVVRELDILDNAGQLPPMPQVMLDRGISIVDSEVEFVAPINRAMQAAEGVAIMTTLQSLAPIAQFDKSVMFMPKGDPIGRKLAAINGMAAKYFHTPEEIQAAMKQQAQTAQTQNLIQAAPLLAGAAKDMTAAQSGGGPSPPQPPVQIPAGK